MAERPWQILAIIGPCELLTQGLVLGLVLLRDMVCNVGKQRQRGSNVFARQPFVERVAAQDPASRATAPEPLGSPCKRPSSTPRVVSVRMISSG